MDHRLAVLLVNGPEAGAPSEAPRSFHWSRIQQEAPPQVLWSPTAAHQKTVPVWLEGGRLVVPKQVGDWAAVPISDTAPSRRWLYLRSGVLEGRPLALSRLNDQQAILFSFPLQPPLGGPAAMIPMKGQLLRESGPVSPSEPGCQCLSLAEDTPPGRPADGWLNPVITFWSLACPAGELRPTRQLELWRRLIDAGPLEIHPIFPAELAGRAAFLAWGERILSLRPSASRSAVELLFWGEGDGAAPVWPAFLALDQLGGAFRMSGAGKLPVPRRSWRQPGLTDPIAAEAGRLWAAAWGGESVVAQEFPASVPRLGEIFSNAGFQPCPLSADWWSQLELAYLLRYAQPAEPFLAIRLLGEWLDGQRRIAEEALKERLKDHRQCCKDLLPQIDELLTWLRDRAALGAPWLDLEAIRQRRVWTGLAEKLIRNVGHLLFNELIEAALGPLGGATGPSWLDAQRRWATSHLGSALRPGPNGAVGFDAFAYLEGFARGFIVPGSPLQIEIPLLAGVDPSGLETDFDPCRSKVHGARNFAIRLLGSLVAEGLPASPSARRQVAAEVWWRRWEEGLFKTEGRSEMALQERPGFRVGRSRLGRDDLGPGDASSPPRSQMRF